MNHRSQTEHSTSTLDLNLNAPFATPSRDSHQVQPEGPQIEPGYAYPFSLTPSEFPQTFYRLHCAYNWRDLTSPSTFTHNSKNNSRVSMLEMDHGEGMSMEPSVNYHPPEHGWSAKNTHTPLPFLPREILKVVREHFRERGASSSSIFVPGIWNPKSFSAVSLWDREEDAVDEGRRFGGERGGVKVYAVNGELLRREGSVVFCMEELLGRDSGLCWLTKGRYRQRKGKKGCGLRGKAYLVVGVIPGTHNVPRTPPVTSVTTTNNTKNTSRIKSEREDIIVEQRPQRLSSPLTCNPIQKNPTNFDFEIFGQEQSDKKTSLQIQNISSKNTTPLSSKRVRERTLSGGHSNTEMDPHSHERIRDRREPRGEKRNSVATEMEMEMEEMGENNTTTNGDAEELQRENIASMSTGMEAVSEDAKVNARATHLTSSQPATPLKESREIPRSQDQNNSGRKIHSRAGIPRMNTFGTRPWSGDISMGSGSSSPAQPSHNFAMGSRRPGINNRHMAGTETSASRDGYSSDDSLSAGSDIPAIAKPKPPTLTAKNLNMTPLTPRRPTKFQKSSGGAKVAGHWAEAGPSRRSNDPLDHGKKNQASSKSIPKAQHEKTLAKANTSMRGTASLHRVPEEWPLKNKEPLADIGSPDSQRRVAGKRTIADTADPIDQNSHSDSTELHRPKSDPCKMGRQPRKPESQPKPKPIPELEEEEEEQEVWLYKRVIASGVRQYNGESKDCHLVEWEGDWEPTWEPKRQNEQMKSEWKRKCDFWKAQSKTQAGKTLTAEKKIERVLFDEKAWRRHTFLVQYTSDLRPEWVKSSEVDDQLMKDFLERKKMWRKWDGRGGEVVSKDQ
ncbi:hypothetical protein DSL72_001626 [Monilinia vaccinii-corymbosi]|uniref:Chromo domain-containing protein n=1 Tax=Monilinia vaccinii-corymbosi TaxID=61207 RepID=A0A8A3PAN4_9HELO|nr:hypothetical protein DSL72_001626 [Monilinia vaccinii-corymbosi]